MTRKRLLKNRKGLSPIFATLILISIAMIAGTVVYMFTSKNFAAVTASVGVSGTENVRVQVASISIKHGATVYIEQTGGPTATVNSLIIEDVNGNAVGAITGSFTVNGVAGTKNTVTLNMGTVTSIMGATPAKLTAANIGSLYSITITTKAGSSFNSPQVLATA